MQRSKNISFYLLLLALVLTNSFVIAQKDAMMLYDGNRFYFDSNYVQSTYAYREALKLNPKNTKANFNLGAALYRNGKEIKNTRVCLC